MESQQRKAAFCYNPREHWDAIGEVIASAERSSAEGYGVGGSGDPFYRSVEWSAPARFQEWVRPRDSYLDIGSGLGRDVGRLRELGVRAVGCDIAWNLLRLAQENLRASNLPAPVVQWDGKRLPFRTGFFDIVAANTVMQHVIDDNIARSIFKDVKRVLRPSGHFIIGEEIASKKRKVIAAHEIRRTVNEYSEFARGAGLRLVKVRVRGTPTIYALVSLYSRLRRDWAANKVLGALRVSSSAPSRGRNRLQLTAKLLVVTLSRLADPLLRHFNLDDHATLVFSNAPPG